MAALDDTWMLVAASLSMAWPVPIFVSVGALV
jgi:hypothetical protein